MPLTREPSQRALNWVKWNSSKASLNSHHSSKRFEPEIVHLGGGRVGTAFEVLDLPAPDRSKPTERPLTQWAFNPPPPNPPGIGIAIACPEDSPKDTANAFNLDSDRPITQWFPELQPEEQKSKNESHHLPPKTVYPYTNSKRNTAEESLPSPLSPSSSSNATRDSATTVSPLESPVSPIEFPETTPIRLAQFPKRSTSLSQASRYQPSPVAKRIVGHNSPLKANESQLRRTQSNADVSRAVEWRGLPPQPISRETKDSIYAREASPHEPRIQEPQRITRSSPKPINTIQDAHMLPPLTSAPPNIPLPLITGTKLAGQGKAREQNHRRGRSNSSDRSHERSPIIEAQEQASAQQPGPEHKLTPKERFWLHRHYRGEAMFLKAWGLQITSEEDREEGRGILRELMERETQEERESQERQEKRESQERQRMHHRSGSLSRSSSATASTSRDGGALDVIAEERLSREFHVRPTGSSGYASAADEKFWDGENETGDQRRRKFVGLEKHSRNESTDSVLEQYLDLRLSHSN
ncbi:hypothetical protein F5Y12DRAFT_428581 [Xylaria sp. FL1777]|nr:hypothetical protein F5Y12DRAFT_428581 [Xylaria sp. FL1777]